MTDIITSKDRNNRYAKNRPYDLSILVEEYKTMTQPELAKKYGVSLRTLTRWLEAAGARKRKGNYFKGPRMKTEEENV